MSRAKKRGRQQFSKRDRGRVRLGLPAKQQTRLAAETGDGVRWCFYCRKRVRFIRRVYVPTEPMSYYGPHASTACENGHFNGDCFPGMNREWDETTKEEP